MHTRELLGGEKQHVWSIELALEPAAEFFSRLARKSTVRRISI